MKKAKLPTDINKRAKSIVDIATGESEDKNKEVDEVKLAAQALGRLGGLKGGKARANSMTPERRKEIAQKAAAKRWDRLAGMATNLKSHKKVVTSQRGNIQTMIRAQLLEIR